MINKTFGSGGDYTSPYTAYQWLLTQDPLADDYTFDQVGDCSVTASMWAAGELDCNGHAVLFTNTTNSHNGDINAGHVIALSVAGSLGGNPSGYTTHAITFRNLRVTTTSGNPAFFTQPGAVIMMGISGDYTYENIIIVGNKGQEAFDPPGVGGSGMIIKACKVYNVHHIMYLGGSTTNPGQRKVNWYVENCTFYNCNGGCYIEVAPFVNMYFNNVVSVGYSGGVVFWPYTSYGFHTQTSACIFNNCADDDNSLATQINGSVANNCENNIVPANEFISLDSSDPDFLKPNTTGVLADGGIIPVYVTADIAGNPIPYYGNYPIGCHVGTISRIVYLPEATGSGKEYAIKNVDTDITVVDAIEEDASGSLNNEDYYILRQWENISVVDIAAHQWRIV